MSSSFGQDYDQSYFNSPVEHGIRLSGSFAELRTNHFHMGIDIKSSKGRSGDPILAAADGVISRINVDPSGYGNAIYIDHDNGYTTVYAHLSAFSDSLSSYISQQQYKTKSYRQQLYPDSLFFVKQGEAIGRMGNSGRSFGPHLHFEIRETKSEAPVNPFLFGIKPSDKRHPVIRAIKFYASDTLGTYEELMELKVINKGKGIFELENKITELPAKQISMAVDIYDQMDGAYNRNGVYLMKVLVDNKVLHGYRMDKVSYSESHFINAFIDYAEKQKSKRQFTNCYTYPVDQLSVYRHKKSRNGIITLSKTAAKNVLIELQDFDGNISTLDLQLKMAKDSLEKSTSFYNYAIQNDEQNIIRRPNADIIFESESFLNNTNIKVSSSQETKDGYRLPFFTIGDESMPLFKDYHVTLTGLSIPDSLKNNFLVYKCEDDDRVDLKGSWDGEDYQLKLDEFGSFESGFDFSVPRIIPINLKTDMSGQSSIKLKIKDDYKPGSRSTWLKYEGTMDGQWVLFQYDLKNDLIYYNFDENCPAGKHILNLSVTDHRGNKNSLNYQFSRF